MTQDIPQFCGLRVRVSKHMDRTKPVWIFPVDRFVEYEQKDEAWCRRLGIGHEEQHTFVMRVGNELVMHPETWERMKEAML